MKSRKTIGLVLACALFGQTAALPAIVSGSLVKTPQGAVAVEQLTVGDLVLGRHVNGTVVSTPITKITSCTSQTIYVISTELGNFLAAHDQLFYDPVADEWILAQNLTPENFFLTYSGEHLACLGTEPIDAPTDAILLSLATPHTFFVSDVEVLTHNIAITAGFAIGWGAGKIFFDGLMLGIGALGCWIGKKLLTKEKVAQPVDVSFHPDEFLQACGQYGPPVPPSSPTVLKKDKGKGKSGKNRPKKGKKGKKGSPKQGDSVTDSGSSETKEAGRVWDTPQKGDGWTKARGDQGWKDKDGNTWKIDHKHKDTGRTSRPCAHWDVSNKKGAKIREVAIDGKELWPNGPKNKNKKPKV